MNLMAHSKANIQFHLLGSFSDQRGRFNLVLPRIVAFEKNCHKKTLFDKKTVSFAQKHFLNKNCHKKKLNHHFWTPNPELCP